METPHHWPFYQYTYRVCALRRVTVTDCSPYVASQFNSPSLFCPSLEWDHRSTTAEKIFQDITFLSTEVLFCTTPVDTL